MKRLFTILAAMCMTASMMAEGHMKFKGVEITGSTKEFIKQLVNKGFKYTGVLQEGVSTLSGDFAGHKDCTLMIVSVGNEVVRVNVVFHEQSSWSPLYENYTSIKEMLTQKYGDPAIDKEEWQGYRGKPTDDNSCMHELNMDRAKIYCGYETENGSINLQIVKMSYANFVVLLSYFDNESQERLRNNAIDDL